MQAGANAELSRDNEAYTDQDKEYDHGEHEQG
jgi:hypothetical protein